MLEDQLSDILNKALRGLNLTAADCGVDGIDLSNLNEQQLAQVAEKLNLAPEKLQKLNQPFKHTYLPTGLHCMTSSFGELGVNCFVLHHDEHVLLFDTGTDPEAADYLEPSQIFITHEHPDHTACLDKFANVPCHTPQTLRAEQTIEIGALTIQTFDVSGHCQPALAYLVTGLSTPVCIVGDAVFKRSMGGCQAPSSYQQALTNNSRLLNTLSPETILCVGHGPNTTVEAELADNPFFDTPN